jgi:hypothetical protein
MKIAAAAIAGAVAAAAAAFLLRPHAERPAPVAAPARQIQPQVAEGRKFLDKAQVDQAIASGALNHPVKSLLIVERPMRFGDYVWNDRGVAAGPAWIRVDPAAQLISVFRAGDEIGTAVIVYGGDNKETPRGTFHILGRYREHRSSLYDAEMPYTLQLTGDGVSIHGSTVRWGAATHGCIGVPLEFARRLFDQVKVGDEVDIVSPAKNEQAPAVS